MKLVDIIKDCGCNMSEGMQYHTDNNISLLENVYRPFSKSYFQLFEEARKLHEEGRIQLTEQELEVIKGTDLGRFSTYKGLKVPLDYPMSQEQLMEAKKEKDNKVQLNKPRRNPGGKKKFVVFVKTPKGNVKKIQFGDVHGGLSTKVSDPKARKAFSKRHNCPEKKDKTKAGYWACRVNRYAQLNNGKTYPGYW